MSTPHPQGESDRPLTRRELRELADKQTREAQALSAASAASAVPQANYQPAQSQPIQRQSVQQQSNQSQQYYRPAQNVGAAQAANAHSAYGQNPADPRPGGGAAAAQTSSRAEPRLEPRAIVEPQQEAVQVTRRSMYSQAPAAGVPQVIPPSQASAVRLLEETGTISKLVDPKDFESYSASGSQTSSGQGSNGQTSSAQAFDQGARAAGTQQHNGGQGFPSRQSTQPSSRMSSAQAPSQFPAQPSAQYPTQSQSQAQAFSQAQQQAGLSAPQRTPVQESANGQGRSNLSGYMRQAPPSSQIPRVEQDAAGNWVASSAASVAERSDRPLLPSWNANDLPFTSISAASAASARNEPAYEPTAGYGQSQAARSNLPAREATAQHSFGQAAFGQPQFGQAAFGQSGSENTGFGQQAAASNVTSVSASQLQAPFGAPVQQPFGASASASAGAGAQQQTQAHQPFGAAGQQSPFGQPQPQTSAQGLSQPAAHPAGHIEPHSVAPAWDAITARNSSLPQDPTRGGVSIESVMTGQQQIVDSPIRTAAGRQGSVDNGVGEQEQEPLPASIAPKGAQKDTQTSINAFQESGPTLTTEEDEEEFELDHSYTWLHYLVLVAVAFVLGMIIWKVGLDSAAASTEEDQPENAAAVTLFQEQLL